MNQPISQRSSLRGAHRWQRDLARRGLELRVEHVGERPVQPGVAPPRFAGDERRPEVDGRRVGQVFAVHLDGREPLVAPGPEAVEPPADQPPGHGLTPGLDRAVPGAARLARRARRRALDPVLCELDRVDALGQEPVAVGVDQPPGPVDLADAEERLRRLHAGRREDEQRHDEPATEHQDHEDRIGRTPQGQGLIQPLTGPHRAGRTVCGLRASLKPAGRLLASQR